MLGYLEEEKLCFIEIIENNNEKLDKDAKKKLMVYNSEKEAIKKRALYKKKRNA